MEVKERERCDRDLRGDGVTDPAALEEMLADEQQRAGAGVREMKRGVVEVARLDDEAHERGHAPEILERRRPSQDARECVEADADARARDGRRRSDEQRRDDGEREQQPVRRARRVQPAQERCEQPPRRARSAGRKRRAGDTSRRGGSCSRTSSASRSPRPSTSACASATSSGYVAAQGRSKRLHERAVPRARDDQRESSPSYASSSGDLIVSVYWPAARCGAGILRREPFAPSRSAAARSARR